MNELALHIEYLLFRHNCVIVPGLGSFMTDDEPARYDYEAREFRPPHRSLCFNPEVRHNDAMLVSSISRRSSVTVESARHILENEVASLRHQLELNGEAPLGNLGLLVRGDTPEYPLFEPSDSSLPMRLFAGFRPLAVNSIVMAEESMQPYVAEPQAKTINIPLPLKIVASVMFMLVALGILYSTTSLVGGEKMKFASLDTGLSSTVAAVVDVTPDSESLSHEIVLNIACPVDEQTVANNTASARSYSIGRYILVVASYQSYAQASRHIAYVGDSSLKIIEMDGNYRVYTASASSIEEARIAAERFSTRYPNVWVCRR